MAKNFVMQEGEKDANVQRVNQDGFQKYLKNDGYDSRRVAVFVDGMSEYALQQALDKVEAGILAEEKQNVQVSIPVATMKAYEDRVLVFPDPVVIPKTTIILSEKQVVKPMTGTVIGVGPGKADKLHLQIIGYMINGQQMNAEEAAEYNMKADDVALPMYVGLPMPLKVGDRVMYGRYAGTPYMEGTQEVLILRVADIFGNI